jgi:hypothetical protein
MGKNMEGRDFGTLETTASVFAWKYKHDNLSEYSAI